MSSSKKKPTSVENLIVNCKGLGVGKTTVGLGFEFDRSGLAADIADALLTGARLQVRLDLVDDEPDQIKMFEGGPPTVESIADCHGLSLKVETCSARLTFRKGDVDLEALLKFASRSARLSAERIGNAQRGDADAEAA